MMPPMMPVGKSVTVPRPFLPSGHAYGPALTAVTLHGLPAPLSV